MRALWEVTEQLMVVIGVSLISIQISLMMEYYLAAVLMVIVLLLASGVVMLQFYTHKRN